MELTQKQIRYLKGVGHHLKPVVTLGKEGFSTGVSSELETTLNAHELIKVRVVVEDRDGFRALVAAIATATGAKLVQTLGRTALFYRPSRLPQGASKKLGLALPTL